MKHKVALAKPPTPGRTARVGSSSSRGRFEAEPKKSGPRRKAYPAAPPDTVPVFNSSCALASFP